MMVENFFSRERTVTELLEIENHPNLVLLSGPPSSGKTSLLFQFAFNVANSTNRNVVFICNRHKLESKPPFLSQDIQPSSHVFERIQIKYVNDDEDIKKYFAAFHLYDTLPAAVIIDDFGDFFHDRVCQERYSNSRGRELAMVRSLALCRNAITYANEKACCKFVLSDTHHGNSPRLYFMYKKWIPTNFTIKEGDEPGSFILEDRSYSGTDNSGRIKAARYSIALQALLLETIIEDQAEQKELTKRARNQQSPKKIKTEFCSENLSPISVLDVNDFPILNDTNFSDYTRRSPLGSKSKWKYSTEVTFSNGIAESASKNKGYKSFEETEYYTLRNLTQYFDLHIDTWRAEF